MAILKKLKKGLKKAAKVAIPVGAALLAARAMKNKKLLGATEDGKGGIDTTRRALQAMTSNDAYSDDTMPAMLSKNMGMKGRDSILGKIGINKFDDGNFYQGAKDGGRIGKKSGGKVRGCGIAKRGLGRAMKKGKR
jgi:hypothetical protein